MERVDYVRTFIAVAEDCGAASGTQPPVRENSPSVAARQYQMIADNPYKYTSADVIFTVYADRKGIPEGQRAAERAKFYAKNQPCLRGSDLGKRYGWGIHADEQGRLALYGVDTPEYVELAKKDTDVEVTKAFRSTRASR